MTQEELISLIRSCAYSVRHELGPGFLESVYKNALVFELRSKGLSVETEFPINVNYRGVCVGSYRVDIFVDNRIIIELKAVNDLLPVHEMQLVNYLKAMGLEEGILINYGGDRFQFHIKTRDYHK